MTQRNEKTEFSEHKSRIKKLEYKLKLAEEKRLKHRREKQDGKK